MIHSCYIKCIAPKTTAQTTRRYTKAGGVYTDKKGQGVKDSWVGLLAPHAPDEPFYNPFDLRIIFTWPWRASETKKAKATKWLPMSTKPDLDNLAKTVLDSMVTCGYMTRDQLVWKLMLVKGLGDIPGVGIVMNDELEDDQIVQHMRKAKGNV